MEHTYFQMLWIKALGHYLQKNVGNSKIMTIIDTVFQLMFSEVHLEWLSGA